MGKKSPKGDSENLKKSVKAGLEGSILGAALAPMKTAAETLKRMANDPAEGFAYGAGLSAKNIAKIATAAKEKKIRTKSIEGLENIKEKSSPKGPGNIKELKGLGVI